MPRRKLTDLDPWDPENDETLRAAWDEWDKGFRDWVESLRDLDDWDEEEEECLTMRI